MRSPYTVLGVLLLNKFKKLGKRLECLHQRIDIVQDKLIKLQKC